MGQACGGDLMAGGIKGLDKIDGAFIPAGGEPEDAFIPAVGINNPILIKAEFKAAFEVTVGRTKGVFSGLEQLFRGIDQVNGPLLEFNGLATGVNGRVNQLAGGIDVTVMIDADFGDNKTRVAGADVVIADLNDFIGHRFKKC